MTNYKLKNACVQEIIFNIIRFDFSMCVYFKILYHPYQFILMIIIKNAQQALFILLQYVFFD